MLHRILLNRFSTVLAVSCIAGIFVARLEAQQPEHAKAAASRNSQLGQRTFTTTCAGCHGLDGRGGERAPNITGSAKLRRLSDAELAGIVMNGVPGTGMPGFRSLGAPEIHGVVSYLRLLQGREKIGELPGNPANGKTIFFGKAECSGCHMIHGAGGFLGPDLSTYGANRSAAEILDAITSPAKNVAAIQKSVVAISRDGRTVSGIVRNEDNFSIQILTAEGAYFFLPRSDLRSLEYQDHPIMPTDYKERFTHVELDDVASYLMSVGRAAKPEAVARDDD
jgi:cytochrome c oxidase cbb3-type subunit 3